LLSVFISCEEVDNQLIVPKEFNKFANPLPQKVDYRANNDRHEIIVASIDTGVDYNHPELINHVHFTLDDNGVPIGMGWDFIGNDAWPSPYAVRTAYLDPNMSETKKNDSLKFFERSKKVSALLPQFKDYLAPERSIGQELDSGTAHGTHVSGLMTYDDPRIGLMGFKVLPFNIIYQNGNEVGRGKRVDNFFDNIIKALELAALNNVRVVNLSLSIGEERKIADLLPPQLFVEKMEKVGRFARNHPEMAIVAAAGNDSKWIDESTRLQLPCGVKAKNILCVGALDTTDRIAYFSNIVLIDTPFIFAPGSNILSTFPMKMCNSEAIKKIDSSSFNEESVVNSIKRDCEFFSKGYVRMSGTSMASPIAAREVARQMLEDPTLSGIQAIQALLKSGRNFQKGPLKLTKLRVAKPLWYKKADSIDNSFARLNFPLTNNNSYWEMVVPQE
jgi:subtilisin family serine protease